MIDKKEYIRLIKNISRRVANIENKGFETAATKRFREVFGYQGFFKTKGVDEKTLQKNLQTLRYIDTLKTSKVNLEKIEKAEMLKDFFDNDNIYKIYDFIDEISDNVLSKYYKYKAIDFVNKNYSNYKRLTNKRKLEIIDDLQKEFPNIQFRKLEKA